MTKPIDVALAIILALTPLLPRGFTYFGWHERGYIDLVPLSLAGLALLARYLDPPRAVRSRLPTWPWDLLLAATLGLGFTGLIADNRVTSPVFAAVARSGFRDLFGPINQATHPLYAVRVALTFFEGWLTFRIVLALCDRAADPVGRARVGLLGWALGATAAAAAAGVQYVTRTNLQLYWVKANPALVRANGTMDDPNTLGAVLAMSIGLCAVFAYANRARTRLAWLVLGAAALAGALATMSRSALGAAVLAPVLVLASAVIPRTRLEQRARTAARAVLALAIVLVLASLAVRQVVGGHRSTNPTGLVPMVVGTFDPRESNGWVLRGRLAWWRAAVGMFEDHPISGVGLGRYPRLMGAYGGGPYQENTHNLFLQFLAEGGVIGAGVFIAFAAGLLLIVARTTPTGPRAQAARVAALIATTVLCLTLLTGHLLLVPSGQILFASLVALLLVQAGSDEASPTRVAARPRTRAFVACLAAAALISPVIAVVQGVGPAEGAFGYVSGLYDLEPTTGGTSVYRWTRGDAQLDVQVPAGSSAIELRFAAPYPIRGDRPTTVEVRVAETSGTAVLDTAEMRSLHFPLPAQPSPRRVVIAIAVRPALAPGAVVPADQRELGVQLFPPVFSAEAAGADVQ